MTRRHSQVTFPFDSMVAVSAAQLKKDTNSFPPDLTLSGWSRQKSFFNPLIGAIVSSEMLYCNKFLFCFQRLPFPVFHGKRKPYFQKPNRQKLASLYQRIRSLKSKYFRDLIIWKNLFVTHPIFITP